MYSAGGIASFVSGLNVGKELIHEPIFLTSSQPSPEIPDADDRRRGRWIQWNDSYRERLLLHQQHPQ